MMTFGQMYIIKNYIIDEDKLRKKLDANKKKIKPKSKWQQRMDDAMKKKGYKQ
jgi:YidC/Oxa1 family membrane protein insertase